MKRILMLVMIMLSVLFVSTSFAVSFNLKNTTAVNRIVENHNDRYVLENQYILLCDYLSGTNTHAVLGLPEVGQYLMDMMASDPNKEVVLFQYVIQLQVALQLKVNINWWYSCRWHTEPWAISYAVSNMNALFEAALPKGIKPKAIKDPKQLGIAIHANLKK